ncbi:hypothetical protein BDW42DRAFT_162219 [Aspergillus taichungensis]|uniref:Zn(2)-C6 fungal-type domain-containing protein n=1 Tax=Aspergillus taichungensis TaxID=482145 RepID=A0A2J5I3T6_9EURO|nr:hypothetical protein BDW42DRAFT_162219 [Aspergillus taichungensis]
MQNSPLDGRNLPSWGAPNHLTSSVSGSHPTPGTQSDLAYQSRRRNQLACESCYKKKIKCEVDGSNAACVQCMRRNIRCKFTSRREKRGDLKRTHYVKSLEERLRRTEDLLRAAGLLGEETLNEENLSSSEDEQLEEGSDVDHDQDDSPNPRLDPNKRSSGILASNSTKDSDHAADQDPPSDTAAGVDGSESSTSATGRQRFGQNPLQQVPVFKWDAREEHRYFGRSSSLSILSRDGIEWIKNKTGEKKFLRLLVSDSSHDCPWDYWRPDVFHDVFSSQVFKPLPPRAEVFSLLRDYFRTLNRLFPLYHEATFMKLVEWQYTQQTCDDAARWASINIIISLAYEYRYSNTQKSEKDRERAWLYYKNAMSVFAELTLRRTDLLSVQALLGMALFLRGNSGTQSTLPIITAAIRASHRLGLHRNIPRPHLPPAEQEQRKRVFWIAYILDQSTCIRSGNAPTQHYEDLDVEFPVEEESEFVLTNNTSFFRQLCSMTVIKSRIYNKLYATTALENKSALEIIGIVRGLHADLEKWKATSAFDLALKHERGGEDFLVGFASAGLQFVYYNSLIMVHRVPLVIHFIYAHRLATGGQVPIDLKAILKESLTSTAVCVQAARDTLRLVNNLPWGDIAWIWSLLYYIFLAVIMIFVNILRDSGHPKVKEDIQSLNVAATFFATLIPGDGPCNYARFMTRMCANFERTARTVFERHQKTATRPTDRQIQSRDPTITSESNTTAVSSASSSRNDRPPAAPKSLSPDRSPASNTNVPSNIKGFPRVNSSGYVVVPGSPPQNPVHLNTAPAVIHQNHHHHQQQQAQPQQQPQPQPPIHQTYPQPNNLPTTQTDPYSLQNFFPFDPASGFFAQPDLWQIPLTADWEFGGQFLPGLFGGPAAPFYQGDIPGQSHPQPPHQQTTPTPIDMSYGYMQHGPSQSPHQHPSQTQTTSTLQGHDPTTVSMWTNTGYTDPFLRGGMGGQADGRMYY